MNKQIGWVEQTKLQKTLGATTADDRKTASMVALGFLQRDGGNLKLTARGRKFAGGDQATALRDAIADNDLYRSTIEWIHYGRREVLTAAEIGQHWEDHHNDILGGLKAGTLKDGAVCFGRIAEGAALGTFKVGRAGKETRFNSDLASVAQFIESSPNVAEPMENTTSDGDDVAGEASVLESPPSIAADPVEATRPVTTPAQSTTTSTSPNVHVNVEIHIAADATAETVKEIFKNMARYVLDKPTSSSNVDE